MEESDLDKQKQIQNRIRENLEAIMKESQKPSLVSPMDEDPLSTEKAEHPNARPLDLHREKKSFEREAKKVLDKAMKFYVDHKYIGKDEYLEYKKGFDALALSNIMFSMRFTQHALIKIMEDIDMGNTHPRTFEALSTLNGQLMSVIKHYAAFMATIETNMRQTQQDLVIAEHKQEEARTEDAEATVVVDQPMRVRGTKALIQGLKKDASMGEAPEVPPALVDPSNRPINPFENLEEKKDENEKGSIDASEYF